MRYKTMAPTNLGNSLDTAKLSMIELHTLQSLWLYKDLSCAGVGFIAIDEFSSKIKLEVEVILSALKNLVKNKLIALDESTFEVFILDWYKHHTFGSPVSKDILKKQIQKIESKKIKKIVIEKSMGCFPTRTATSTATSIKKERVPSLSIKNKKTCLPTAPPTFKPYEHETGAFIKNKKDEELIKLLMDRYGAESTRAAAQEAKIRAGNGWVSEIAKILNGNGKRGSKLSEGKWNDFDKKDYTKGVGGAENNFSF